MLDICRGIQPAGPVRTDQPAARAGFGVAEVEPHRRLLRECWSGVLHSFVFFGFLVLLTAIRQNFGAGLFPGFSLATIGVTTWAALLQDIFDVLIIIALAMAACRVSGVTVFAPIARGLSKMEL